MMAIFYLFVFTADYLHKTNGLWKYILAELKTIFRTLTLGILIALIVLYLVIVINIILTIATYNVQAIYYYLTSP